VVAGKRNANTAVPADVSRTHDVPRDQAAHDRDLRSFGRRRGRALSARQKTLWNEVLPRVALPRDASALCQSATLFAPPVNEVWLEIGFGGGEHLVWQATHNPQAGLIGCEPFEDGVVKVLSAIDTHRLANIRVHPDDGRPLLRLLPEASVARVFFLFPDPWPKKRHYKRRLVSTDMVAELARILVPGGELRIATDVGEYACAILRAVLGHPSFSWTARSAEDWRSRPSDWPQTRYEAKALEQGRRCYYFSFRRV
jgi:tRNA (guanine-N7-)-methyltransferase